MTDLTTSAIDRQNILNNIQAIENIQTHIGISGMLFKDEYRFTKLQVSNFFEINVSTIDRYLTKHDKEIKYNGYLVLKGNELKEFKKNFGWIMQEGSRAPQLGIFNFKSLLNLGMLLSESDKAKLLRSTILDVVIDTLNKKVGGSTKYINQRDEEFFFTILQEPHYRKEFTTALNKYLEMGNYKYELYTDSIYKAVFQENASEYKGILQLEDKDNVRDTMYAEVLRIISSFESGIAFEMRNEAERLARRLLPEELDSLIKKFSEHPLYQPLIMDARIKMASRDYGLRKVIHDRLQSYIRSVPPEEYERFLGEKSKELLERIEENIDVFKRLKER